jgi:ribosomal protein S1
MGEAGLFKLCNTGDIYMYSPKVLPKHIAGKSTDGHFLNIKNVSLEDLQNILDQFEFGKDAQPGLKENFIQARKEQLQQAKTTPQTKVMSPEIIKQIEALPTLSDKQLQIDKKYEGIINNINGKNIYINLTPTIIGLLKSDKKEKELTPGEKIQVKITDIRNQDQKTYISLQKIA